MDDEYHPDETRPEGDMIEETFHSFIVSRPSTDNKTVVVKQCRDRQNPRTTVRWQDEVEILKVIASGHENLTQILDSNKEELTITLRHEPGMSLDKHIDTYQYCTFSSSDSHAFLCQISSALAFIHSKSIVHDDVKPQNIMYTDYPCQHAVLIDFGAAFNQDIVGKDYWKLSGTPLYIPPEFLDKRKGPEGDIWAFGVTMMFAIGSMVFRDTEFFIPHLFTDPDTRKDMIDWIDEVHECVDELEHSGDDELIRRMLDRQFQSRITAAELVREVINRFHEDDG